MNRFAELASVRIKRVGTVDTVAQHLREMIADGRLKQGDKLPEIPLSEALGVSRNTLRDALRVLSSDGLIEHELHRGAVVRKLSARDVIDIYTIRRMLELRGLEALPEAPVAARQKLGEALDRLEAALVASDYTMLVECELSFHGAIVGLLDSERLDRFFAQVLAEQRLLLSGLSEDSAPAASRRLVNLYRRVVRAAEASDTEQAVELMRGHLDRYEQRVIAAIASDTP